MVFIRASFVAVLGAALLIPAVSASRVHRAPTAGQSTHKKYSAHRRGSARHTRASRVRGQQAIDPDRVRQIQTALIGAHYLSGEPSGAWDSSTIVAMQKYQADHGWQTKLMPDSRALKTLGLGADYSDAINARSASFTAPPPDSTIPATQDAGFTAASGTATDSTAPGPGAN